jgi:hypothetical protein
MAKDINPVTASARATKIGTNCIIRASSLSKGIQERPHIRIHIGMIHLCHDNSDGMRP